MSMDWFRSWHGAPTDPKWLLIAKRSETQAGVVSAIVWALFDFASQNSSDRGSVEAFDAETYAAFSGFDEGSIKRVIECLKEKNLIIDGHLAAWEKRQTKREDNSTPRVQKHRNAVKRNVTQETAREEKTREEETREEKIDSEANASGASAPRDRAVEKKTRKGIATAIPDGYSLPEKVALFGATQGLTDSEMNREHQRFCNHAKQNDRRCVDWVAAERNWLIGTAEKLGRSPPASGAVPDDDRFLAKAESEELAAWDAYGMKTRNKSFPRDRNGDWRFPSRWPPGYVPAAKVDPPPAPNLRAMQ